MYIVNKYKMCGEQEQLVFGDVAINDGHCKEQEGEVHKLNQ